MLTHHHLEPGDHAIGLSVARHFEHVAQSYHSLVRRQVTLIVNLLTNVAKVFGKLKSFNCKPQACASGMDGSLGAVSANTHACGLRLNDLSARQGKLPPPP